MLGEGRKKRSEAAAIDSADTECSAVLLCIHPGYRRGRVCRQPGAGGLLALQSISSGCEQRADTSATDPLLRLLLVPLLAPR